MDKVVQSLKRATKQNLHKVGRKKKSMLVVRGVTTNVGQIYEKFGYQPVISKFM